MCKRLWASVLSLTIAMIPHLTYADPPARPIVYVFDNAIATFGPGNPFSAVIGINGLFQVDPDSQTIVAMNITLSNLPTVISYYDVPYTAGGIPIAASGYQFYTVASNGNNGLDIAFTAPLDNKEPAPLYQVVLWPQQWGQTSTLKVTGAAEPILPFGRLAYDNCHGQSIAGLAQTYGGFKAAAAALGYPNLNALQSTIMAFCGG
jgi:hypothetical protein